MNHSTYLSPIGRLRISSKNDKLTHIEFINTDDNSKDPTSPFNQEVIEQLSCYFKNPKHQFSLPFHLDVTDYQRQVLSALQKIQSGETKSYGEIAHLIDSGARAVGNACRHNPIPIIIPCHRVTAKRHLGGYCGRITGVMTDTKKKLLQHEKIVF